jgi:ABC-2 type transport system ATP-binding protein
MLPPGVERAELPPQAAGAQPDNDGGVSFRTSEPVPVLNALTGWALERGIDLEGLEVRRPSLEDVYLDLTGEHG